ncbi:hypothetical protein C8R48DRAFT_361841 [Suillus tomentosus]|nr:hypothetical protein C8R48DRAFT_361841 [Suillus tomentosus]
MKSKGVTTIYAGTLRWRFALLSIHTLSEYGLKCWPFVRRKVSLIFATRTVLWPLYEKYDRQIRTFHGDRVKRD